VNAIPLLIGAADHAVAIEPRMANRHGLIAGATGTGKTVTLQVLAQAFSDLGVPVFVPDIKGDFSGVAAPGSPSDRLTERARRVGIDRSNSTAHPPSSGTSSVTTAPLAPHHRRFRTGAAEPPVEPQ